MNTLIRKAQHQHEESFVTLMESNAKDMYKIAYAILSNNEDVADAIQDTILSCWEKLHTLKQEEYFKTWMTKILMNHCNRILRKKRRLVPTDTVFDIQCGEECSGYKNAEWQEMLQCIDEKYRIVLVLYYGEGFKVREISEILQESESAVKRRLVGARKRMEQMYYPEKRRDSK